jgi:hypothetical protein
MKNQKNNFPLLNKMANGLLEALNAISEQDLEALLEECHTVNATNCWWVTFGVANLLEPSVRFKVDCKKADKAQVEDSK